jgi:hypothetical protein
MKKIIIAILSATILLTNTPAQGATKPLNSKENKSSCTYLRTNYQSSVMLDWSNGLATDSDVLKEIDLNIKMLITRSVYTNGKIQKQIKSWLIAEKKTKTSIVNNDIEGVTAGMILKISSVEKLNKLCKSIGK